MCYQINQVLIQDIILHYWVMRGLCHICFRSNVELIILKGHILCQDCFEKNAKN